MNKENMHTKEQINEKRVLVNEVMKEGRETQRKEGKIETLGKGRSDLVNNDKKTLDKRRTK